MVQMRPLIGKEQLRNSKYMSKGTVPMDLDDLGPSAYDTQHSKQLKSVGRTTQMSVSPWNRSG